MLEVKVREEGETEGQGEAEEEQEEGKPEVSFERDALEVMLQTALVSCPHCVTLSRPPSQPTNQPAHHTR